MPTHPLSCHRQRIADRRVFGRVIAAQVHGLSYGRIASPGCSDRTIRRRLRDWAELGLAEQVHLLALEAYDRMIGRDKVAALTDAAPGTVHLDQGNAGAPSWALLDELDLEGDIARHGVPAPRQAGSPWTVERTHRWMNGYGKPRLCTEKRCVVVGFYLFFAAALVVLRRLIQGARLRCRWPSRPTTRRLR